MTTQNGGYCGNLAQIVFAIRCLANFSDPDMKIIRHENTGESAVWAALSDDGGVREIEGDLLGDYRVTDRIVEPGRLLAPISPRAILAVGLNYRAHAEESGKTLPEYPMIFMKLPGAVQDPDGPIVLPRSLQSEKVDYECELAVIIGKRCKNASRENALDHVLGYTCANDVSARDWQLEMGGGQFCRGKTFDTFCPMGPCLVTTDELPDPHTLRITTFVNGEKRQDSSTSDLIFDVPALIEFLSGSTTLEPGTVILTGTPSGVGRAMNPPVYLQPGDIVKVEIDGIGAISNPVAAESV
jgi:2-keto-4-pentenoate hydratase/2-oxohepta-3-ene-1,7-dioic acid hydratase in catechol pathway